MSRPSVTIRRFARWGSWVMWGMALLMGVAMFAMPGPPIYMWITPVITNIGCGFLIRYLRPRMIANAAVWDQMAEGR